MEHEQTIAPESPPPQCDPPGFYSLRWVGSRSNSFAELFDSCVEEYKQVVNLNDLNRVICLLGGDALEPGTGVIVARARLRIAAAHAERRRRTGEIRDYQEVARLLWRASDALPDTHVDKAAVLDLAATAHVQLFGKTWCLDDHRSALQLLGGTLKVRLGTEEQAEVLEHLGMHRAVHFEMTGDLGFLEDAIQSHGKSLDLTPISNTWRRRCTTLLTMAAERSDQTKKATDLEYVLKQRQRLLNNIADDDPHKTAQEELLAQEWCELGARLRDKTTLEKGIQLCDNHLFRLPEDHERRGYTLLFQARAYDAMYDLTRDIAFLEVAVREFSEALDRIPKNTPQRRPWLMNAFKAASTLYQKRLGNVGLEETSRFLQKVIQYLPENSSDRLRALHLHAAIGYDKYQRWQDQSVLEDAIRRYEDLLWEMLPDDPNRQGSESRLVLLVAREKASRGEFVPLKELETISEEDMPWIPRNASDSFREKFMNELLGFISEEDEETSKNWISELEDMQRKTAQNHPFQVMVAMRLEARYSMLHAKTKAKTYMEEAVRWMSKGAHAKVDDERAEPFRLAFAHKVAWWEYFSKASRGRTEPDEKAELDTVLQRAIQATQDMSAKRRGSSYLVLQGHAVALRGQWCRTQSEADLDQCIQMYQESLAATPNDDKTMSALLHGLGDAFYWKFMTRNAEKDLEAAIKYSDQAVEKSGSSDSLDRAIYLHSLGNAFIARFPRTRSLDDLNMAIQQLEKAVETIDTSRTNTLPTAQFRADLGFAYYIRYRVSKAPHQPDLDLAISKFEEARESVLLLDGKELASKAACGLSIVYGERYKLLKNDEDWVKQTQCLHDVLDHMSKDHRRRWCFLEWLGQAYLEKFQNTRQDDLRREAVTHFEDAFFHCTKQGRATSTSGRVLFWIYASSGEWHRAFRVASELISQVRCATGWSLEHSDKQSILRHYAGLASEAAAAALHAGESAYVALRLLETGIGVIISSLLGLRSEVDELKRDHPAEAKRYLELRDQVDSVEPSLSNPAAAWLPVHQPTYRHDKAEALEKVINDIRALPTGRFESFLKAPSAEDMKAVADGGPIVVINISQYGCHAIIVKTDDITAHSLPNVTMADLQSRVRGNVGANAMTSSVLEWLWDEIAKPVLDILGFTTSCARDGTWPRVRWIPIGPLTKLPLHAAGYHLLPGHMTVMDRVISSYSVSLTTLAQSRASLRKRDEGSHENLGSSPGAHSMPKSLAVIAMNELPNARKEAQVVTDICSTMSISRPASTHQQVLEALKSCNIFHFAGHGTSNYIDPSNSALVLDKSEKLTVSNLFDVNLHKRRPFLAYLSACSTGQVKQNEFIDEGLHLISAFQIAGFQHVIGTMWEVRDKTCVPVAESVYKYMHAQGMSHCSVAGGLHNATRQLRNQWVRDSEKLNDDDHRSEDGHLQIKDGTRTIKSVQEVPLDWVPYVHFGI